ncbi:TrbC/VirB2 family protein (plasmid) [Asticcacaulis sp. DW145]|uniref:TrbC/VirB2 family protein n=1 Tax=Asticcacaulis sp. DW145 TaxID=3095608 RepID=UPI0030877793|nr:TrbC/VirB2 family protein [Asticcacaulis sp. DW145]
MRMTAFSKTALANPYVRTGLIVALTALSMADPAFAQIAKLTTVMDNVKAALVAIGVVAFTIAILWAGYKMAFQHAKWSEVANIVIGGVFVGGAAEIAGWIIN